MGNYLQVDQTQIFHLATLTVAWFAIANVAIIAALFKNSILGFYIHAVLTWIVISFSLISPLLYLVPLGVQGPCDPVIAQQQGQQCQQLQFTHNVIGTIVTCYIGLQAISGFITRAFQQNPNFSTLAILRTKKCHQFSGYIILLLAKFNCYIQWIQTIEVLIPLVIWDLVCIIIYIKLKWFSLSFQKSIVDQKVYNLTYSVKKIKNLGELKNGKLGYVIFANYVYDVSPLITLHPAGYQTIQPARGRQVDRFLYGMYSAEGFSNVSRFSHPDSSLKLLGQPVAKMNIKNLYSSMLQTNQCQIFESILISSKSDIYLFRIALKAKSNFIYSGYSQINQIGGYFSLTVKNTTRLYTKVGCLRAQNIDLVNKIMQNHPLSNMKISKNKNEVSFRQKSSKIHNNFQITQSDALIKKQQMLELSLMQNGKMKTSADNSSDISNNGNNTIPLLIKIYTEGQLTPNLVLSQQENMQISCQRGQGLQLDTLKPGNLIFIAGGTGLYPFIDLIDILFKISVLNTNDIDQSITNRIMKGDPIVKNNFLQNFQFKFYIGVHSVQDLHPITLYQLYYLSSSKKIHCLFKLHKSQTMNKQYQDFELTKEYFHDVALDDILSLKTSKTFICGPPVMLEAFADLFKKNDVDRNKYEFV